MKKLSTSSVRDVLVIGFVTAAAFAPGAWAANIACTWNGKPFDPNVSGAFSGKTGMLKCTDKSTGKVVEEQQYRNGIKFGHHLYSRGDVTIIENRDERGREQGIVKWYRKGRLTSEINYKNGDKVGLSKEFWENGKPKEISWTADDSWHSLSFEVQYLKDGRIYQLFCHKTSKPGNELGKKLCGWEGKPVKSEIFSFAGSHSRTVIYQNGQQVEKTSFGSDGKVAVHEVSSGGIKKVTENYPNGKVKAVAEYKGRYLQGKRLEYSESGKLVRKSTWVEGHMTSEEEYYLNGQMKSRAQRKKDGDTWLIARQNFSDQGSLVEDGVYAEKIADSTWMGFDLGSWVYTVPVGLHRRFNDKGVLVLSENFDREGRLQGTRRTYYDNSKPESSEGYVKGVLKWKKSWDWKTGKLIRDEEYFEDGSRKNHIRKSGQGI